MRSGLVLGQEIGEVGRRRSVAQVDVLIPYVLLDPVVGDADVLVARSDGIDGRPFLGRDVVADEE